MGKMTDDQHYRKGELERDNPNYTIIPNSALFDNRLTAKATGIFCLAMALSEGQDFSMRELQVYFKDKRASIKSGLIELEKFGYLELSKTKGVRTWRFCVPKEAIIKTGE